MAKLARLSILATALGLAVAGCAGYDYPPRPELAAIMAAANDEAFLPEQEQGVTHQAWMSEQLAEIVQERLDSAPTPDVMLTYGFSQTYPTPQSLRYFEPVIGDLLANRGRFVFMIASDDVFSDTDTATDLAQRRVRNVIAEMLVRGVYLTQMYYRIELPRAALSEEPRLDPYARIVRAYILDFPEGVNARTTPDDGPE